MIRLAVTATTAERICAVVPVNFNDPEGLNAANPGYCDASEAYCGATFWDPSGRIVVEGGGGGGGFPAGSYGAILDGLTQYFQGLGYSVLPGTVALPAGGIGITICVGSGVCEVIAITAGGAAIGASIGWGVGKLANIYFARKADVRQFAAAGKQVGREPGCRPPNTADFNAVHEMIKDQKGPDGKVPYDVLLDAWREVLCQGNSSDKDPQ